MRISVTPSAAAALLRKGSSKMLILLVPWFQAIRDWLFAVFGHDRRSAASAGSVSCASRARVIEFRVPETFQAPQRRWVPPGARGKLIEFSMRGVQKSA